MNTRTIRWALLITLSALSVRADWNRDEPSKWAQLPDETPAGVDVKLNHSQMQPPLILADDFLCRKTGPITDIHLWTSWLEDQIPPPDAVGFTLSIWSDVPAGIDKPYSHPGSLLWMTNVGYSAYSVRVWTNVTPGEGWYDPAYNLYEPAADTLIWQYNFLFDAETAFIQTGTEQEPIIYWLAVQVNLPPMGSMGIGWKSSTNHWNDDAVWAAEPGVWQELRYPQGHPYAGESIDLAFVITTTTRDFGDAPDPTYPTLLVNNGARHVIVPGVQMGLLIDAESDGQPDASATGDDKANVDDEDGMLISSVITNGAATPFIIGFSTSGYLSAWVDFNIDGDWYDPGEQIYSVHAVTAGVNHLSMSVPNTGTNGATFARFRFTTSQAPLAPTGSAPDGEVEDSELTLVDEEPEELLDFGDAMDSPLGVVYPTLLIHNGARHMLVPGVFLGAVIDTEPDGQPTLNADGDDLNPPMMLDDEDGIVLPAVFIAGSVANVQITASTQGFLNAWIDWNANSTWVDPGEQVFFNQPIPAGTSTLIVNVPVPPQIKAGGPHSRWRFTTYAPAAPSYVGLETDGEVEDYEVHLEILDFGDAPDPAYPTMLANDGARHRIPSPFWLGGQAPDLEPDGQPAAGAVGDDAAGVDDEDGITLTAALLRGSNVIVQAVASTNGFLNGWLDFDQNGSWSDAGEQVVTDLAVTSGLNAVSFAIPAGAAVGSTYARFRLSSVSGLSFTGIASDGEVEDYAFVIGQSGPAADIVITSIVHIAGSTGVVFWIWETNVTYQLESTTNLLSPASPDWISVGGTVLAPAHMQTDPGMTGSAKFYRVIAPWTP